MLSKQPIQTQQKSCPECGGERILAAGTPTMGVYNAQIKRWFGVPTSPLNALVCVDCGYTVFYARNPSQLRR